MANVPAYPIYTEEFAPFSFHAQNKQVIGTASRKVERLFNLANYDFKLALYPWFRAQKIVYETPNTFIYSLVRTKEREDKYHWIMPLCPLNIALFKLARRTDIHVDHLEQAKSYVIGVERQQLTVDFLLNKGFVENKNLVIVKDHTQTRGMLNKGRVDMVFGTESYIFNRNQQESESKRWQLLFRIEEMSRPMYLAANKDSDLDVVHKLQRTFKQNKQNIFDSMGCGIKDIERNINAN